ncbi:YdgA family protein [Pseudomonas sp. M30-35]|uniref:YdgA family protein n=1 Tax=Pseudomonas sp. M30-35 TaxID=1981174 RepID=UPI000B3D20EF|nr:YdgA family protein [Pseudomonas sp. M30-35]ARU87622.1 hypothetical protein B9K09_06435 [Pseudomonas sp. M30-35]
MKKTAGIAAALVVAIGVISTAGAWYTGTQLQGVLQSTITDVNQQYKEALVGTGIAIKFEVVSLETHWFTSTARYRLSFTAPANENLPEHLELLFRDNIQHGPLPVSRLKRLNLWPVMLASNYELEANKFTQKWFDAAKGASPLTGESSLGYDGSPSGTLVFAPLDFAPTPTATIKFSGLTLDAEATKNAEKVVIAGGMDSLVISTADNTGKPVRAELRGLTFNSDQQRGSGDFYLGDHNLKLATAQFNFDDKPAVLVKDISQSGSLNETKGLLDGGLAYDIGMLTYDGKDLASMHMLWSLKNFDVAAVQAFIEIYRDLVIKLQQAQALGQDKPDIALSPEEEARLKTSIGNLLDAKPQVALEKLSIKTTNGEALLSMVLDLKKPEPFELPLSERVKQTIAQLDAKLSVSKEVIADGVRAQAIFTGETDSKAIEDQAAMFTEMASGMALGTGLLTLEGENLQSSLHYANDKVVFNGQEMTTEEFAMFVMSKANGIGGGALGGDAPSQDYAPD